MKPLITSRITFWRITRRHSSRVVDLQTRLAVPPATSPEQAHTRVRALPLQVHSLNLTKHLKARAGRLLDHAGVPADVNRLRVHVAGGVMVGFVTALGIVLLTLILNVSISTWSAAAFVALLALFGGIAPLLHLRSRARQRSEALARDLPDALDLLALATAAGLAIDAAVARVAESLSDPLREELRRWRRDVTLGVSRGQALREMAARTGVPDISRWASVMAQAESTGAPLAEVLRSQATIQREYRALKAEERAQRLPVTMVVPLILCVLPALLLIVIGPAVLSIAGSGALP